MKIGKEALNILNQRKIEVDERNEEEETDN